ncbi:putative Enoyl-CoA hydratase/isomerase [metagenome]|uniref:Putative Enoyl-CoA hydratase/isomerase n=1 Tax=metagenome TaxID=256318 RepID=A0A2P2CFV2_9ZZZZ
MTGLVETRDDGSLRRVRLNRPERANALSPELVESLHAALDEAERDRVRGVVLEGSARHFCAGFDLGRLAEESDATLAHRFLRIGLLLERLASAPYVTLAVVTGSAVGAGADLAAACDHRLGTPEASFRFPGAGFGVVLGTARLASLVGPDLALELVAGRRLDGEQAAGAGLLSLCTPQDRLDGELGRIGALMDRVHPVSAPALLRATRPALDDGPLAALARSVAIPGLHHRLLEHTRTPTPTR